jgi:hypothetical protein
VTVIRALFSKGKSAPWKSKPTLSTYLPPAMREVDSSVWRTGKSPEKLKTFHPKTPRPSAVHNDHFREKKGL